MDSLQGSSASMTFPNSVTNWEYMSQRGTSLIQTTTEDLQQGGCIGAAPMCECCSLDASHAAPRSESLVASCWVLGKGLNPDLINGHNRMVLFGAAVRIWKSGMVGERKPPKTRPWTLCLIPQTSSCLSISLPQFYLHHDRHEVSCHHEATCHHDALSPSPQTQSKGASEPQPARVEPGKQMLSSLRYLSRRHKSLTE